MRVLLVEDESRIAGFVRRGLGTAGFAVDWVTTGSEALDLALSTGPCRPDLVLLDLGLPDLDGLVVLARLRDGGCHTPVIVLTARTHPMDRDRATELGIDDYITKPFSIADLVASFPAAPAR